MARPSRVEHVVVLMMENRSFDHLLGHLDHGSLQPIDGDVTNIKDVSDPQGEICRAHFLSSDRDVSVDPGHHFEDVTRQLTADEPPLVHDRITMDGFAWNYARRLVDRDGDPAQACDIMGCHTAERVPVLSTLAREYAVCSRWFCSVPSETWPNRLFAHGAQSDGLIHNDIRAYTHRTTFDVLRDAKVPWAVYAGDVPQAAAYFELVDAFKDRFNTIGEFFEDVRDGTLPYYSFIEPRHFRRVDSQHPTHSVLLGDQLLRSVYTAIAANAELWRSTLLLVTWDEHGGFFDRAIPPQTVAPFPGMTSDHGFGFDILGVRVPAIVVSPFVSAQTTDDEVHDHASIVRTVLEGAGLDEHLTARDAQAASVLPLLTLDEPRAPAELPPPAPRLRGAVAEHGTREPFELDDLQLSLVKLTRQLDQHRAPKTRGPTPPVEPVASPIDVDRLVAHFQVEHMGDRAARLANDDRLGG